MGSAGSASSAEAGTRVRVRIGGAEQEAMVSDGVFTVPAGTMSFAPGSSGWPRGDGSGDRASYELFARGGNAAEMFGNPPSGTPIEVLS